MITIKNIVDYTDDQLFFELQINRAAEVDITCKPEKIVESKLPKEDYIYYMNEYITEASDGYMHLTNLIKNGNEASYGMCPSCKKTINFNVTSSEVNLSEKVYEKVVRYYNDEFSPKTMEWLPEASVAMDERVKELLDKAKFFDKYLKCPLCGNMYRVSFALEYNKEKNCIYLIKIGQYPSLHEFAVENMSDLTKF